MKTHELLEDVTEEELYRRAIKKILANEGLPDITAITKLEITSSDNIILVFTDPVHSVPTTLFIYPDQLVKSIRAVVRSFMRSSMMCYVYARDVIKGPWPEGEAIIAKSPMASLGYAKAVLNGRFLAGEDGIASVPGVAYNYAISIIQHRWPPCEPAMAKSTLASSYARNVIKGPWPEAGIE